MFCDVVVAMVVVVCIFKTFCLVYSLLFQSLVLAIGGGRV